MHSRCLKDCSKYNAELQQEHTIISESADYIQKLTNESKDELMQNNQNYISIG